MAPRDKTEFDNIQQKAPDKPPVEKQREKSNPQRAEEDEQGSTEGSV